MKFSVKDISNKYEEIQETVDILEFIGEIHNGNLHFLYIATMKHHLCKSQV